MTDETPPEHPPDASTPEDPEKPGILEQTRNNLVRFLQRPHAIVILTAAYLLFAYLAILLVDIMEFRNLNHWIGDRYRHGLLWWYIFMEKGPTEFLQYSFLATVAVLAAVLSGRLRATGQKDAANFWLLLAILGAVLSIEDATSYRYTLNGYIAGFSGNGYGSPVRIFVETFYYGAIAAIPVYAFLRYWKIAWGGPSRWWLITGYAAYAIAASASITRYIGFWYMEIGNRIDALTGGKLNEGYTPRHDRDPGAGNWFMDLVVEESIEVMAAALLVAAVLAYRRHHQQQGQEEDGNAPPES